MLDASAELLTTLRGSYVTKLHVNAWRGDELLASDIPVSSGTLDMDRSLAVPERLSCSVPRYDGTTSWVPKSNDHPLAAYGQILQVNLGVFVGDTEEILRLGWYPITESSVEGDTVSVTAAGMLQLIDEAKFIAPFEPTGTFGDTVEALVEPAITVIFNGLTDRNVPIGMKWDEDRIGGLNEVLDAWPADAYVTEDGYLLVTAEPDVETATPVWDVTDDPETGTVVKWSGGTQRDGAYNVVVARGETDDNEQVFGVQFDTDQSSSFAYGGPFNPLPVPFVFYSPLLKTVAQCESAARSIMSRKRRARSKQIAVDCVPCPVLRLGDVVSVTGDGLTDARGTIENISLPLTPGGGNMSMKLSLVVGI